MTSPHAPLTAADLADIERRAQDRFYAAAYQDVMRLLAEVRRLQAGEFSGPEMDSLIAKFEAEEEAATAEPTGS